MRFAVIGVNHRNCPIELREKVSFTHNKLLACLRELKEVQKMQEVVLLSTCNRSELYLYDENLETALSKGIAFYQSYFEEDVMPYLSIRQGEEALRHLFEVTSGLDSIVVGEDQILGQVKKAHSDAMSEQASGKVLNKIFREAISTAKHIKSELKISEHPLSISHIAVKFLKEKQGTLKGKKALVIGTGQMNELTIKYLLEEGISKIYVTNRTHTKAVALTELYEDLDPVPYERRYEVLPKVDVVVSATASPHVILQADKMPELSSRLDIMDIAMPRDIDPAIDELDQVHVYDIDGLKLISKANNERRLELVARAQKEIEESLQKLIKWLETLSVDEVVQGLDAYCEAIKRHTTKVLSKKILNEELDEDAMSMIMAETLKRCMRTPIAKLMTTESPEQRMRYAKMLSELFELN